MTARNGGASLMPATSNGADPLSFNNGYHYMSPVAGGGGGGAINGGAGNLGGDFQDAYAGSYEQPFSPPNQINAGHQMAPNNRVPIQGQPQGQGQGQGQAQAQGRYSKILSSSSCVFLLHYNLPSPPTLSPTSHGHLQCPEWWW